MQQSHLYTPRIEDNRAEGDFSRGARGSIYTWSRLHLPVVLGAGVAQIGGLGARRALGRR